MPEKGNSQASEQKLVQVPIFVEGENGLELSPNLGEHDSNQVLNWGKKMVDEAEERKKQDWWDK